MLFQLMLFQLMLFLRMLFLLLLMLLLMPVRFSLRLVCGTPCPCVITPVL